MIIRSLACSFRALILLLQVAWLLALNPSVPLAAEPTTYRILVLHSYHPEYAWTANVSRGLSNGLRDTPEVDYQLDYFYMDTKRIDETAYFQNLYRLLQVKYQGLSSPFNAVVAVDNDALFFMEMFGDRLFGQTPVVFCGINNLDPANLRYRDRYTGVTETVSALETLQLALRLHPEVRTVWVINDQTTTGLAIRRQIEDDLKLLPSRIRTDFLDPMPQQQLLQTVRALPKDTLVYFTVYDRDSRGTYLEQSALIKRVAQSSPVPVYGGWDFQLGSGIVGGKLTSGFYQGDAAARLLQQVLEGLAPRDIPVLQASANVYMFDHEQLERFGIARAAVPPNSVLINTPDSRYRTYLLTGSVAAGSLLLLVFFLAYSIHRRKLAEIELLDVQVHLEKRVEERTRQLRAANKKLQFENQQRKKAEEEIRHLAYFDNLTGLPNRALCVDRLDQALARAKREKTMLGLLFFDLDRFKQVNDRLGHSMGDKLLQQVAQRLRPLVRESDTLARFGGDEFVMILHNLNHRRAADIVALKVVEALEEPLLVDGEELVTTTSVGIALYPTDGKDSATLLRCADLAMYCAKNQGRSVFRRFDPKMLQQGTPAAGRNRN